MTPCPFCGAGASDLYVEKVVIGTEQYFYRVRCTSCDAYGPDSALRQSAVDYWNERKEIV